MDAPEQQPPVSEPLRSTPVPIAKLSPTLENLSDSSVHAVVTLLWPYSSSTRSLCLLLAEPDFRLRRTNGQVKVVFHGLVAEEVAKSQVGIGDSVYIGLAGSRFVDNDATKQTPGRFVAWDVHFDSSVFIEVPPRINLVNNAQCSPGLDLAFVAAPLDRESRPPFIPAARRRRCDCTPSHAYCQ